MSRETDDARALRRLLQALNEPGASAARNELDGDGTLIVRAPRNGVTMVRTRIVARIGDAAVSEGLAAWSSDAAPRLSITEAGRAFLRRAAAPKGANPFHAQHAEYATQALDKGAPPMRINAAESPLAWLARRKDKDGRLRRAFEAVGPGLTRILIDVCGCLKGLTIVEREYGMKPRTAKRLLRIALEALACHYGLGVEAKGPARAKGVTHWGAEDYRPRM